MTNQTPFRSAFLAAAIALGGVAMVGCTTTPPGSEPAPRMDRTSMDSQVDATLSRLYSTVPGSREMVQKAAGVLVFPAVIGGSFVVGAEYGRGALKVGGRTTDYYSTTAGSVGFQAGGQSKAIIYVFNTTDALNKFRASNGWSAGADATVTMGKVGANGSVDTQTIQQPVTSFVLTNVGLEVGVSVQGAKINKITL
ncbi:BPSL1445 family SYLF domain-containing lipoprotein [Ottowia thiooxydans]|uniref:BPSL1445 family SYLF domain-containing lipoprotein n=1 Tax=Ottowia thiooxydans TaxID=219182 RepID=UPI00041C9A1E|nr:YSC84-related protein [Ottowia thiooxydans]